MASDTRNSAEKNETDVEKVAAETPDPRDTDHPTGTQQAAENAADESPS